MHILSQGQQKAFLLYSTSLEAGENSSAESEEPPEGYYAFVESPNAEPPRVRPPPYTHASVDCREDEDRTPHVELIRNMTLKYLSRTLPILKADETLPKVAQLQDDLVSQNTITAFQNNDRSDRSKRETNSTEKPTDDNQLNKTSPETVERQSRKFCDQGGVFCMLYKAINGEPLTSPSVSSSHLPIERRDEAPLTQPRYEGPPTPCPAKVEYATPVFAKNYQGIWRYVVQIPYEGYFTQTIEVTRCLQQRCHYLDGGCLSSPRWSSLLVAEIYYPDTVLSSSDTTNPQRSPVAASQPPQFKTSK
ncbi:hypothetical protein NQ314_012215 [Rhamnusium bicolor]|uniref:Spaetzle domain-containing protein n=1 Tax=Rhamnusium bicolor TaxID=1586634 RepID=A0AAV8XC37_9CUCU|nr:hypothetical protein NQ314_012215 [Rhamnusium bicolor]